MALHHYVPQFILREFLDPDSPPEREPYLWIFDGGPDTPPRKRGWKRQPVRKVAAQARYNTLLDEQGRPHDRIETEALGPVESDAARIYRERVLAYEPLDPAEKLTFATFVALSVSRVPSWRRHHDQDLTEDARAFIRRVIDDPEALARANKLYEERTGQPGIDRVTLEKVGPERVRVTGENSEHLLNLAKFVQDVTPVFYRMNWVFLHSDGDDFFITSDKPVSLRYDEDTKPRRGILDEAVQQFMPLAPDTCLFMHWGEVPGWHASVDRETVEELNIYTIMKYDKTIISRKPTFPGMEYLQVY